MKGYIEKRVVDVEKFIIISRSTVINKLLIVNEILPSYLGWTMWFKIPHTNRTLFAPTLLGGGAI